jgi:hypothetical protein
VDMLAIRSSRHSHEVEKAPPMVLGPEAAAHSAGCVWREDRTRCSVVREPERVMRRLHITRRVGVSE